MTVFCLPGTMPDWGRDEEEDSIRNSIRDRERDR
jgi:hypothetical protein